MNDEKLFDFKEVDGEIVAILKKNKKEELENKKLESKYKKSCIPEDYWNLGFRHAIVGQNKEVVSFCSDYYKDIVENRKKYNLYLYGDNSTGKSTTACAIGKQFIKNGKKVKFILADHLIDLLMKTSGYSYIEELEKEKKEYINCDFVIIDDAFDKNKVLTWETSNKNHIISRWDSFLRDLISNNVKIAATSNIRFDKILEYYGRSIYELLDRNFKILEFKERNIKETRKKELEI